MRISAKLSNYDFEFESSDDSYGSEDVLKIDGRSIDPSRREVEETIQVLETYLKAIR